MIFCFLSLLDTLGIIFWELVSELEAKSLLGL